MTVFTEDHQRVDGGGIRTLGVCQHASNAALGSELGEAADVSTSWELFWSRQSKNCNVSNRTGPLDVVSVGLTSAGMLDVVIRMWRPRWMGNHCIAQVL